MATTAERWETGNGDGSGIYLAGAPATRRKIGDFSEGGRSDSSEVCQARAQLAAAAPEMRAATRLALDVVHAGHAALEADCPDIVCRQLHDALAKAEG